MADLKSMEAMASKRFRVVEVQALQKHWTVFARDPKHAVQLVQEGQGRDAGTQGPKHVGYQVGEYPPSDPEQGKIVEAVK